MMARSRFTLITLLLLVVGGMLAAPARSDDWLQFRKDPWRRAASSDEVRLPLTEVWRWEPPRSGSSPSSSGGPFHAAIWKDRIFYEHGRLLMCADARTGRMIWRQALLVPGGRQRQPGTALAVSESGIVFTYDDFGHRNGQIVPDARFGPPIFSARAFSAVTGQPLTMYPIERRWFRSLNRPRGLPDKVEWPGADGHVRLVLSEGVPGQTAFLDNREVGRHFVTGASPPLVLGDSIWVTSQNDMLFRWRVGHDASYLTLARGPAGPVNERLLVEARFDGCPPTGTSTGAVVVARGPVRFLASIGPGNESVWHRDVPWIVGIPAVQENLIFTGIGGVRANRGVLATDAATGAPRWIYPTPTVLGDPADPPAHVETRSARPGETGVGTHGIPLPERLANVGVVVTGGRVYAEVTGSIVALDQVTGRPVWRQPLPPRSQLAGMVASRGHLLLSMAVHGGGALVALRLEDGREEWAQPVPRAGGLSLAHGLVYHTDGASVVAYAPAERTYRLAVDSPHKEDYEEPPRKREDVEGPEKGADEPENEPAEVEPAVPAQEASESKEPAVPPAPKAPPAADASILRLRWSEPLDDLVRKVRERRAVAKGLPLTLVLDWLNADRSALAGPAGWSLAQTEAFAAACRRLAAEGRPDYFEVGSEVNAYLVRYPDQIESVRSLLKTARQAVAEVSPQTQVMVSLNLELWRGLYSRGVYFPFGKLPARKPATLAQIQSLVEDGSAVAFTSWPEAASARAAEVPSNHFHAARAGFPQQLLLWTRLSVRYNPQVPVEQGMYLQRLFQSCYWLKASVIAYPELRAEGQPGPDRDYALRDADGAGRPSHLAWQSARLLKWVKRLSLEGPPPQEFGAEPGGEPAREPAPQQ